MAPPMTVPLPTLENPAHMNAEARARLRRTLAERDLVELAWNQRLSDPIAVYNQRTCLDDNQPFLSPSSAKLDPRTFDCHQKLSPLHPHRKQLQLLQQHIATSPSLSHAWRRYEDLESISSWNTTTQLDVFEFTACLAAVHRQYNDNHFFLPGCSWRTPYPWLDIWRRTFQLDTMLGIPQHTTPAARAVANVPAERLLHGLCPLN